MSDAGTVFDLVVIGSGPGGYVAAIRAAQLGMNVACVEKHTALGGTCLNVGCIPSKALLDSSEHFWNARHGFEAHGIRATVELDLPAMLKRKDTVVRGLTGGVGALFKQNKVTRIEGVAKISKPGLVEVSKHGERQSVAAKRILIATGGKPAALPGVPFDGRRIVHSTDALTLPAVPPRMIVVGAGAIGLELGSVWRRLGAEVAVYEFLDRIVPGMDRQSGQMLQKALERQGLRFTFQSSVKFARVNGDGVQVQIEIGGALREETCDVLLVAVGRRAYTDGLGAKELGLKLDERGRVLVNSRFESNVEGVFAIGDVIPGPMLAHKAEEEGIAAVEGMAGQPVHVNYESIPNVVYTWPELASVGWSEERAKEQGRAVNVGAFPFLANGRARAMNEREGQVKLIADASTDRLLGGHILGPRASDLIAEVAFAIEMGASAEDLARSCHAHPTLPEAVKEAAMAVAKRAIHI